MHFLLPTRTATWGRMAARAELLAEHLPPARSSSRVAAPTENANVGLHALSAASSRDYVVAGQVSARVRLAVESRADVAVLRDPGSDDAVAQTPPVPVQVPRRSRSLQSTVLALVHRAARTLGRSSADQAGMPHGRGSSAGNTHPVFLETGVGVLFTSPPVVASRRRRSTAYRCLRIQYCVVRSSGLMRAHRSR
jgi:hypothetical protein